MLKSARIFNTLNPLVRRFLLPKYTFSRNNSSIIACMWQLSHEKAAIVKSLPGSDMLTITVQLGGKLRNLDRAKTELVEKPLLRLQKTLTEKKQKKKQKNQDGEIFEKDAGFLTRENNTVELYKGPSVGYPRIDPASTKNEDAWVQDYLLRIGDHDYPIIVNPPYVEKIQIHGTGFVGIPLVPFVDLLFTDYCTWKWWKKCQGDEAWQEIQGATTRTYIPTFVDEGYILRVECTPIQSKKSHFDDPPHGLSQDIPRIFRGISRMCETGPIRGAPPRPAACRINPMKQKWTDASTLRVMTYNILADQYASTDAAKDDLFAYCPNEYLEWQYRRPIILQEILDYKPDIACVQEMDILGFDLLFQPAMNEFGFDALYTNKAGRVNEGSSIFWRREKYQRIAQHELEMKKLFPIECDKDSIHQAALGPELEPLLLSSPNLCEALQRVGTIAQMVILAPTGDPETWGTQRPLCVLNTHLFFHYAAPHVRTIHVWAMLEYAKRFISDTIKHHGDALGNIEPSLIFCGDLNSDINDGIPGAVELLRSGVVPENFWDWKFGKSFSWGDPGRSEDESIGDRQSNDGTSRTSSRREENKVCGIKLTSTFSLASSDDMKPEFTNYVKGYQGLLDYIWYDKQNLSVQKSILCPTAKELGGYIPSRDFPSDHIPVVADLAFEAHVPDEEDDGIPFGAVVDASLRHVPLAVDILQRGDVIAVPTDTIYGLAALATSATGIKKIYEMKRRDLSKPLAVCVADYDDIQSICNTDHIPEGLLKDLLPGPVTVVLDRKSSDKIICEELNPGVSALAVRIPNCNLLRAICRQLQAPIALTSANLSGSESPIRAQEIHGVSNSCSLILDAGVLGEKRAGSTIVDLTIPGCYAILREGSAYSETTSTLTKHGLLLNV